MRLLSGSILFASIAPPVTGLYLFDGVTKSRRDRSNLRGSGGFAYHQNHQTWPQPHHSTGGYRHNLTRNNSRHPRQAWNTLPHLHPSTGGYRHNLTRDNSRRPQQAWNTLPHLHPSTGGYRHNLTRNNSRHQQKLSEGTHASAHHRHQTWSHLLRSQHNCFTRDQPSQWSTEKKEWCCSNEKKGCDWIHTKQPQPWLTSETGHGSPNEGL